ncbi:MAG: sialate O-acetylesterase [Candidatus Methylacidiphilales bacterium]|nr:sialate O-acetylesterase [Candidatus Methylacidiphilales bacterium]
MSPSQIAVPISMKIESGLAHGQFLQRRPEGARALIAGTCSAKGKLPVTAMVHCGDIALWKSAEESGCGRDSVPDPGRVIGCAEDGRFSATLDEIPSGGPYFITLFCGREHLQITDVYVGDLWLMAGQSNMEGCGLMSGAAEPIPQARCFTMARRWEMACEPLHLRAESPDAVHNPRANAAGVVLPDRRASARMRRQATCGAGVGLHFARLMYERTEVPQGLIATAHGGTSMLQWDPSLGRQGGRSLYGSMLLSLRAAAQPLAGVLWYQGESEALPHLAREYVPAMRRLIAAVRRDTAQPNLPWLMVQIGRFIRHSAFPQNAWPQEAAWNEIQEKQRLLPRSVPYCAIVPSIDLELDDCAHIGADSFPVLAWRLAVRAADLVLGDKSGGGEINPISIRYKCSHMRSPRGAVPRVNHCIIVEFTGVLGILQCPGRVHGFSLSNPDGRTTPTVYRIEADKELADADIASARITLFITDVPPAGALLSYGQGLDPHCSLTDSRGMPVPVFGPLPVSRIPAATEEWVVRKKQKERVEASTC